MDWGRVPASRRRVSVVPFTSDGRMEEVDWLNEALFVVMNMLLQSAAIKYKALDLLVQQHSSAHLLSWDVNHDQKNKQSTRWNRLPITLWRFCWTHPVKIRPCMGQTQNSLEWSIPSGLQTSQDELVKGWMGFLSGLVSSAIWPQISRKTWMEYNSDTGCRNDQKCSSKIGFC